MSKMSIKVSVAVDALHCWPNAPDHRSYLRYSHRHKFHVTACAKVSHAERMIEFHDMQDRLKEAILSLATEKSRSKGVLDFASASCETIGQKVLELLPYADLVEVIEDEDCGAVIERG